MYRVDVGLVESNCSAKQKRCVFGQMARQLGTPELRPLSGEEGSPFKPVPSLEDQLQAEIQAKSDTSPDKYLPTEFPDVQMRLCAARSVKRSADGAILESFVVRPSKKLNTGKPTLLPFRPIPPTPIFTPTARPIPMNRTLFGTVPVLDLNAPKPTPPQQQPKRVMEFKVAQLEERDPLPPRPKRKTAPPKPFTGQVYYKMDEPFLSPPDKFKPVPMSIRRVVTSPVLGAL
jgi:hypothetical protein